MAGGMFLGKRKEVSDITNQKLKLEEKEQTDRKFRHKFSLTQKI